MAATLHPEPGDWVICVMSREANNLHKQYPEVRLMPVNPDALRGFNLTGRAFITEQADQNAQAPRIREMVKYCTLATGADPTVQRLPS
jgi:hypothetical protein